MRSLGIKGAMVRSNWGPPPAPPPPPRAPPFPSIPPSHPSLPPLPPATTAHRSLRVAWTSSNISQGRWTAEEPPGPCVSPDSTEVSA